MNVRMVLTFLVIMLGLVLMTGCGSLGARPDVATVQPTPTETVQPVVQVAPAPVPVADPTPNGNLYQLEQLVENCVGKMLRVSHDVERTSGVLRATKACSHIYGLDHERRLEEYEIVNESDGDLGPITLDGDRPGFLPSSLLRTRLSVDTE